MEKHDQQGDPVPPGCFRLEELNVLQSFEKLQVNDVFYYVWHDQPRPGVAPHRFLYAVEMVFDTGSSLLISSGEDSEAIRLLTADDLADTAMRLQKIHGKPVLQRFPASIQPMWRDITGKTLDGIRLSRNEAGLFLNDALMFDFGEQRILVRLSEREGLLAGGY